MLNLNKPIRLIHLDQAANQSMMNDVKASTIISQESKEMFS